MSTLSLRLPESLHNAVKKAAKQDHISINQFMATALAEKLSALWTEDYLLSRSKNAPSKKEYEKLISKAPRIKPHEQDIL